MNHLGKAKHKFSPDEDKLLKEQVLKLGEKGWKKIAEYLPGRSARQCRERYKNYLCPSVSSDPWTKDEDEKLLNL